MKAADTSIIVAAFASWHERHESARAALAAGVRLVDHCALETYSVLTRLPAPHRAPAQLVRQFLRERFTGSLLRLPAAAYRSFVLSLPEHDVAGGAAYDALIAATAAHVGAQLISCDRKAASIYERYGVACQLI
jgi:predicted nucleic acid-binding protein